MNKIKVVGMAGLVVTVALSGCGGSSSGSEESPVEKVSEGEQPKTESLSVPSYAPQSITEENSEDVVKSVYSHLRYIAWDTVPDSDLSPEPFTPDQLVREFTETDTIDLSTYYCADFGTFTVNILDGVPEVDAEDDLYLGPGDKIELEYNNCSGQFTLPGDTRDGSTTIEVVEGYSQLFGDNTTENIVTLRVSSKDGYVSDSQLVGYMDGDMKTVRGPGSVTLSGTSFKENPANNRFLEYYLGEYSLNFEKTESTTSYERWSFSSDAEFLFGINALGGYFKADLQNLIFTNDQLETGIITLTDEQNSLRIELFESHLTYEMDLDGDGVYEIDRMLNRSEF